MMSHVTGRGSRLFRPTSRPTNTSTWLRVCVAGPSTGGGFFGRRAVAGRSSGGASFEALPSSFAAPVDPAPVARRKSEWFRRSRRNAAPRARYSPGEERHSRPEWCGRLHARCRGSRAANRGSSVARRLERHGSAVAAMCACGLGRCLFPARAAKYTAASTAERTRPSRRPSGSIASPPPYGLRRSAVPFTSMSAMGIEAAWHSRASAAGRFAANTLAATSSSGASMASR